MLREFGAMASTDVRHGISPRIDRIFRYIAEQMSRGKVLLADHLSMLEFISRHHPPAWLLLASLHEESGDPESLNNAKTCVRRFLEAEHSEMDQEDAWQYLANLCRRTDDFSGEAHALVEACELASCDFSRISNTANRLNEASGRTTMDFDEKEILFRRLAATMETHTHEADATDWSRLAWLYIHMRDETERATMHHRGPCERPHQ